MVQCWYMKREIKFRAWDVGLKEMIPVHDIQFHTPLEREVGGIKLKPKPCQPTIINTKTLWRVIESTDAILMQYSGIKDKNGWKIYEGDICKDSDDGIYLITFDEAEFISIYDTNVREYLSETHDQIEVIGNIYENPELVEN